MRRLRWVLFLCLLGLQNLVPESGIAADNTRNLVVSTAIQQGRMALVIGNSAYPAGALANPKNDATAMAAALNDIGFNVELVVDASKAALDNALRKFSAKTEKADVALLFYAGHGIQVNGNNYIVPLDANPQSERDLKREMIKMDDIIDDMGGAKVKLIFFDACRDNPLSRSFSRGGSRGMAAPVEATGTLISFATKHGNTASDGDGRHSPYTQALLAEIQRPNGIEIEQMLRRVQQGVKAATRGQQEPWRYGSLDGDFFFKAPLQQADNSQAMQEAVRQTKEQAERDRAELQQSVEAMRREREAADLKSQEALRQAREQAARDRAELQQSMEKMLKEALARQNALIEAERAARQVGNSAPVQLAAIDPAVSNAGRPRPVDQTAQTLASTPSEEWEYIAKDVFGKSNKVTARVKAVAGSGVLEEYLVDGKQTGEWVLDGKPALLGLPIDATVLFAPYWDGSDIRKLTILNGSRCGRDWTCSVRGDVVGHEKIKVPAGTFDTTKLQIYMTLTSASLRPPLIRIEAWYSEQHKRIVRQTVYTNGQLFKRDETIELVAYRPAPR